MLPSILIVDDEPEVLSSLNRVLRRDFIVHSFQSGEQALEFFKLNPTHLVLSDMKMPGMQGEELLTQIHTINPLTKCCILSGYADIEATEKAINNADIAAYISKPWNNQDLIEKLKELTLGLISKQKTNKKIKSLQKNKTITQLSIDSMLNVITGMLDEQEAVNKELLSQKKSVKQLLTLLSMISVSLFHRQEGHEQRVAEQATVLAETLGLSIQQRINLHFSALLYRIGLTGIDSELINKARDSLSYDEVKLFQESVQISAELMATVDLLIPCSEIVLHLYDSNNSSEASLLKETKILRVVSLFDELVSGAITGNKMSPTKAKVLIKDRYKSEIDQTILSHFIELQNKTSEFSIERAHSIKELREGMILAQDLYQNSGTKLLAEGVTLLPNLIERLAVIEENINEELIIYVKGLGEKNE